MKNRIWEIDFVRGIALLMMIYFHVITDLSDIYGYKISCYTGVNRWIGFLAGLIFIILSGISCTLSSSNLKRGLKILVSGLVVTSATYLYDPSLTVKFGILHFLGISIMFYCVFSRFKWPALTGAGVFIIVFGSLLQKMTIKHNYLFFVGLHTDSFKSSDYYPLIPWFGVFLLGTAAGKLLYQARKSLIPSGLGNNILNRAGRRTLVIYLLHQPVIILAIEAFNRFAGY